MEVSTGQHRAEGVGLWRETASVYGALLRVPRCPVQAGHYLSVGPEGGPDLYYTIACRPADEGRQHMVVRIYIGANSANEPSAALLAALAAGRPLRVSLPLGRALYRPSSGPTALIAAGTGYSYARAIMFEILGHQSAAIPHNRDLQLLWHSRSADDFFDLAILRSMRRQHAGFEPLLFANSGHVPSDFVRMGSAADGDSLTAQLRDDIAHAYIAGPQDFILSTRNYLLRRKVSPSRIMHD
jgi:NAD(P)H-flavin reductase